MNPEEETQIAKNAFTDTDPELKTELQALEGKVKKSALYVNLAEHDGVKLLLIQIDAAVSRYNVFLRDQEVNDEKDRLKRARITAYRNTMVWFKQIFVQAKAKVESGEKKIDELKNSPQE